MKVLRLVVPSTIPYILNVLSETAGVQFDDRMVVDVPLTKPGQLSAAYELESRFAHSKLSTELRNGPNAIAVYEAKVIDLP